MESTGNIENLGKVIHVMINFGISHFSLLAIDACKYI